MKKLESSHQNHSIKRRVFSFPGKMIFLFGTVILFILLFISSIHARISQTGDNYSGSVTMLKFSDTVKTYVGELFLATPGYGAYAIHFDNRGLMYIVKANTPGTGKLSRVTPEGTMTDIASLSGTHIGPGLDMDKEENFYIPLGDHVVKVTPKGEVISLFTCSSMGIKRAIDLVLDSQNNIYIADDIQDKVFKIDTLLNSTVYIDNRLGREQQYSLSDIFFDPDFKNMYLVECARRRILRYPINEQGFPGTAEILYENSRIGQLFNLALAEDSTIVTVPVEGKKLVIITNEGTAEYFLSDAFYVIAARYGGAGFDSNSIYLTTRKGIIRVDLLHPSEINIQKEAVPADF